MTDEDGAPEGRRERLRRETMRDLQAAAMDEVRERGAVGLSLRSVARRVGMSPAGLYRYVTSREELLTLLITGGYRDVARYVRAAIGAPSDDDRVVDLPTDAPPLVAGPDADVADRLRAVAHAYRAWAVEHPNEFGLLFGDPVPGYAAPPDGPTVEAMTGLGMALARPFVEAWRQGRVTRLPTVDPGLAVRVGPLGELAGGVPPEVATMLLLAWGRFHGHVSLEVFGHHHWAFPDGCAALYAADVELMLRDLGVTADRAAGRA